MSEGGYFIVSIRVHGEVQIETYKLQFICEYFKELTTRNLL
jgi:hypothetical protein